MPSEVALPESAIPLLVKGLGAYMRTAPVLDLPPEVRRLRNFHQKMLMSHAGEIVALLEDANVRTLVLQWLDDETQSLPKTQAQALRLAAERADGWEDALAALGGGGRRDGSPRKTDEAARLRDALRRETEKAAAAKDETRRVKESSRKALEEERATVKELRRELEAARRDAAASERAASDARAEAEAARSEAGKLERRVRKDVAAAKTVEQEAAAQLKGVRKELSSARRRIAELERAVESLEEKAKQKPARPAPDSGDGSSRPRRPLPVPPGLLADDPLTLAAWLDAPDVHLLVDGYNVTKSPQGFPDLDLPSQRERLIEQLEKLTLRKNVPTTVVFDGSDVGPGKSRLGKTRVRVEYSRPGEIADDHLMAKLRSLPPHPVVLVTNDRELQERAEDEGATIAVSPQLLELAR
ncbi:MAG TPA: NYN domain-containing protein [Actinomycetota bacterium]|nr:NYN domain-containing protein [Actinomycetota bacterium]